MATVIKKCDDDPSRWGRCQHNWVVRYRDEVGKQREKSFLHDQKSLANALKTEAEHARMSGEPVYPTRTSFTFGEYAERTIRLRPIKQRTHHNYMSILKLHLGSLADRNLDAVARDRAGVTELLVFTLPAAGLGRSTIEIVKALITLVVNTAVKNGDIPGHRLRGIDLGKKAEADIGGKLDPALIEKLDMNAVETIAGALPPRLALTAWLAYGCGLRISEALTVHVSDFSEDLTVLTLVRQLDHSNSNKTHGLKGKDLGTTRKIPVPVWLAQRVRDHVQAFGITEILFPGKRNRYTASYTLYDPHWEKARLAAGLPALRFHDLRHAWCSRLISQGITSAEVAKMAGHRDSAITEQIYFHFLPQAFDRARDVLNNWS
jgi:integrase